MSDTFRKLQRRLLAIAKSLLEIDEPPRGRTRYARPTLCNLEDRITPAEIRLWVGAEAATGMSPTTGGTVQATRAFQTLGTPSSSVARWAVQGANTDSVQDIPFLQIEKLTVQVTYGQTITLNQDLTIGGGLDSTGYAGYMQSGTIEGENNLTILNGWFDWTGGEIGDSQDEGPLILTGTATLQIEQAPTRLARPVESMGTVIQETTNDLEIGDGLTITNNGTWSLRSDRGLTETANAIAHPNFENKGTFKKEQGSSSSWSVMNIDFDNNDTAALLEIANNLTLWFQRDARQTAGATQLNIGSKLKVTDTWLQSGRAMFAFHNSKVIGNLSLQGGDLYVGGEGSYGVFTVTNNYTQGEDARLIIDVSAVEPPEELVVGNTASLDGELVVNTESVPEDPFSIIDGARAGRTDFDVFTWLFYEYDIDRTDPTKFVLVP